MYADEPVHGPGPKSKEHVQSLRAAIRDRPPFCSGTVPVAADDILLFYRKPVTSESGEGEKNIATCLDFADATESDLEKLVDACQIATFGINNEDVLDLSYRKAWKMDSKCFATKLNIVQTGLMDRIRFNLLTGEQGSKPFYAELYKLNVYGKGSFFKPHKDTPRGVEMFGSLVVVLPTAHEGGTLVIRHKDKEWKIDSDSVDNSSISYAAFYGDVEHEVLEVKSGFRVTLTYNLYFGESRDRQAIASTRPLTFSHMKSDMALPPHAESFRTKLAELFADPAFLTKGGLLGFGLAHEYPFAVDYNSPSWICRFDREKKDLERIANVLKGNDAVIVEACRALGLNFGLRLCYTEKDADYVALCRDVPELPSDLSEPCTLIEYLVKNSYVTITNAYGDDKLSEDIDLDDIGTDEFSITRFVHWVTKPTAMFNSFDDHVFAQYAYGNESGMQEVYGRVCLIVKVGRPRRRSVPFGYQDD